MAWHTQTLRDQKRPSVPLTRLPLGEILGILVRGARLPPRPGTRPLCRFGSLASWVVAGR